jgi:hypothetical protein
LHVLLCAGQLTAGCAVGNRPQHELSCPCCSVHLATSVSHLRWAA